MSPLNYNPPGRYSVHPAQSFIRRRPSAPPPVKLNDTQYHQLAGLLAEAIKSDRGTDEILYGNRLYSFTCETEETEKDVFTGVEFLGMAECYTETEITLRNLVLDGVFTLSGNELKADIDCDRLKQLLSEIPMIR